MESIRGGRMNYIKNAIGWAPWAWNPITGCRHHESGICEVKACYAERMSKRLAGRFGYDRQDPFKPTMHWNKMDEPYMQKKPTTIFVGDMGDMWGDNIKELWIRNVLDVCRALPRHTFLFLTKNPKRYRAFCIPRNCWTGTTVNRRKDEHRISSLLFRGRSWISFEPMYENLSGIGMLGTLNAKERKVRCVVIGAQTRPEILPKPEWVGKLVCEADMFGIDVFMKKNLAPLSLYSGKLVQDTPWDIK
jgi:protein gp37